ncbi:uncharacterized protein LOC126370525 isoform X1 [Pectinophora gossypiella]|uniref:uncharacterized protein LOC126370525 isoform X1 n=1 Tax=Pectinophora gossypiella TaxID=13191 RepID=UPI00214F350F|nr:uncharacterized protein LOC126370525 isoform X1 [Pectinophora gossypiella]XP_049871360.1 uncharacterized protein LOC126370525 isoform X1 [Pectinophora gossypiella]
MLGDTLNLALKRFYNLEKRLQKDPVLLDLYSNFIHEYIDLGHATKIDINQYNLDRDPVYFLPHHPVVRMDKKTTKCRTVFDASMKGSKKIALNDILLNGPVVQNELFDVLILSRLEKYIFITDVKHMFRAIELDEKYRSLQNILWRDIPTDNLDCLQLNTVTYGMKSSSYLATRCLMELAENYYKDHPQAAFILKNQTYVDDVIGTASSIESLIESKEQLCRIMDLGGFKLHKWSSNSPELLQNIPLEKQYFDDIELQKNDLLLKTLGIKFNVKSDNLILASPVSEGNVPQTKREILSFISKFFDPLGLAGPIVVSAKLFIQNLWKSRVDWDTKVEGDLKKTWFDYYDSLTKMNPININRYICLDMSVCFQLIGFADASSTVAYGCCIYLRVIDAAGNVKVSLLCAKSRINPLNNNLTTPRLELNAALLLSKLCAKVHKTLSLKFKINNVFLYSDSQIVLAWIATDIIKLNTYVANRVKEITQNTQRCTWSYINTTDNPADCLSRGLLPHEFESHPLWWKGPGFLHTSEYDLPCNVPAVMEDLPESKKEPAHTLVCTTHVPLNLNFLDKFSNLHKMQRVLAYILRFCKNARTNLDRVQCNYLTSKELEKSLLLIVKYEQERHMKDLIHNVSNNKPLSECNLQSLHPFVDDNGMLRVGGRLEKSSLPYSQKHPLILPKGSRLIELIIRSEHIKNLHAGPRLLLSSINQKFWIVNALREIKKVTHKCVICWKLKKKVSEQLMGSLPHDRINVCRPFQKIGLDFCGPVSVKQSTMRRSIVGSGYICVYVCFTTKAVHLELCSDLKTQTFLASFRRFISRRGLPTDVYCDNASNFKCANSELHKLYNSKEHQNQVQDFSSEKGINFHFIPCYSPVFGGLWEAAVKSTKFHLKRVVQRSLLTFEQLITVLYEIEAILNSRPLLPLSNDITDYSYLTPGHFLIGTALNSYPEKDVTNISNNRLTFWQKCNDLKQSFWKVWSNQYLNTLQSRPKWKNMLPNVAIGSLVILKDDNSSPMYWPMARVINVFPGSDGLVRAVEVKTANGKTHRRSVTKVCQLPIN